MSLKLMCRRNWLNFVKKNEKYGWRIYGIGDKIADYKESGSILDWFEHIKEDK